MRKILREVFCTNRSRRQAKMLCTMCVLWVRKNTWNGTTFITFFCFSSIFLLFMCICRTDDVHSIEQQVWQRAFFRLTQQRQPATSTITEKKHAASFTQFGGLEMENLQSNSRMGEIFLPRGLTLSVSSNTSTSMLRDKKKQKYDHRSNNTDSFCTTRNIEFDSIENWGVWEGEDQGYKNRRWKNAAAK